MTHATDTTPVYDFTPGRLPLLISIPHLGTAIPPELQGSLADAAALRQDTDWHLDRLYAFVRDMGASVIQARISRYVIDLNRPPSGESLYPGQTTTGLCPTETFRGEPLYRPGCAPDAAEQARRIEAYWQPYHRRLRQEVDRLQAEHGAVLLWDAHSIASRLPRLFDGRLPDLNFGTADGRSCDPSLTEAVVGALHGASAAHAPFTHVVNGRFKGGYITRRYGQPATGVQAIQLEMSQALYMDEEPPFAYDPAKAATLQPVLQRLIEAALGRLAGLVPRLGQG